MNALGKLLTLVVAYALPHYAYVSAQKNDSTAFANLIHQFDSHKYPLRDMLMLGDSTMGDLYWTLAILGSNRSLGCLDVMIGAPTCGHMFVKTRSCVTPRYYGKHFTLWQASERNSEFMLATDTGIAHRNWQVKLVFSHKTADNYKGLLSFYDTSFTSDLFATIRERGFEVVLFNHGIHDFVFLTMLVNQTRYVHHDTYMRTHIYNFKLHKKVFTKVKALKIWSHMVRRALFGANTSVTQQVTNACFTESIDVISSQGIYLSTNSDCFHTVTQVIMSNTGINLYLNMRCVSF